MTLTIADLQAFQSQHPDYQLELVEGKIIVMSPSDFISEEIIGRLVTFLNNWVLPRKMGRVTGSGAGYIMPNSDLRAPDVSFVRTERLRRSPRSFVELVPDLVVEVRSASDNMKPLREKIQKFLELGAQVGIFINPDKHEVEVYRPNSDAVELLRDGDFLTIPELLPGWEIAIVELWSPVYEENE
ncbi:Uma2 family endonuclease [Phormidesmis priestleyi]